MLSSWSLTREPVRAIELVTEAARIAERAGDQRAFDLAEGYRAWNLTLMRHYDRAIDVARGVVERGPENAGYDTCCAAAVLATCLALHDPLGALHVFEAHLDRSVFSSMMANELLLATAHAANGAVTSAANIVLSVDRRLERSGGDAFPDTLIPSAMLAMTLHDHDRAQRYVSAVRRSPRPTQSLQVTCLYRQLRTQLDDDRRNGEDDVMTTDETERDALDWLATLVETD